MQGISHPGALVLQPIHSKRSGPGPPETLKKWDVAPQTQKKRTEAGGKRNTVGVRLQVALQTAEHTAVKNREGNPGQGRGLEISSLVLILMRKGTDTDPAVVLHTVPEENAVGADQGAEANPTGLKDRDQKVEQEDHAQDLANVLVVEVVKDPVIGEHIAGLVKESGVKAERRKK
ncbi:PREDICTED: uncharacterized protein LOC104468877 [Pterocles gutturalis]|uniref:uncharacterized protein LOC104468877 n=1 Tax=Pterocles gutturalis TaxID=240206 RepID=UPI00052858E2|nr:PREDICTED: uncharacterized protein LOC104468877 [Pterocles gutturalis]